MHLLENHGWVQFAHRWMALLSALLILLFCLHGWLRHMPWSGLVLLALAVILQVKLGVLTLLSQVSLPLATAHQGGALIVFGVLIYNLYLIRKPSQLS